jgi:ATP-dependent Clp protease ATP-binding subunit ClpX
MLRIDTTDILFICGGTFDGLEEIIQRRVRGGSVGFSAEISGREDRNIGEILSLVEPVDLIKYGIIPELAGRLPVIATLNQLEEDELLRILTEPKNAIIKQYEKLFKLEGVELKVQEDALRYVVEKAADKRTGARGLRTIMENIMLDIMFDLPEIAKDIKEIVITKDTIKGTDKPELIHKDRNKKESA